MSWRTIIVSKRAKLELKMNYLVVRAEDTIRVFLDEVSIIIIESTAVSLTAALINECSKRKIKVIFCDQQHNPSCETVSYYGSHDCSRKLRQQIQWDHTIKEILWAKIIAEKIQNQANVLHRYQLPGASLLESYISQLVPGDKTNREGHAAKVYFNDLFGNEFSRDDEMNPINMALNYGYAILLATFNRDIVSKGYSTQLGLFHSNVFNSFNLSSDLMEPFRPLVDILVKEMNPIRFEREERHALVQILELQVTIAAKKQFLPAAIDMYTRSVFDVLESGDMNRFRCWV